MLLAIYCVAINFRKIDTNTCLNYEYYENLAKIILHSIY